MVTMLANQMDKEGLHPFHSSSVVYKGHGILLVGGENNHGKSMTQLEGCRRGASIFSTETTVMDHETGICPVRLQEHLRPQAGQGHRAF